MKLSVVVPLFNEEESLPELVEWIRKVVSPLQIAYEILLIDDGSNDQSWQVIETLSQTYAEVKGIRFRRNYGKSAGLYVGFEQAAGEVIVTMDADLQDSPDEIPELIRMIEQDGFDMVSGWKKRRHDPLSKTLPSKVFNRTVRLVSGIQLHDFNCGLKAYRHEVVKNIEVYGEMHRYIPLIAKRSGFHRIGEKVVQHRERKYGYSKFGIERTLKGFLDLMSVMFISKFSKRPMHLFGTLGTLMFVIGFFASAWLGIKKMWFVYHGIKASLVTDSPYFFIALACMIMGTQLFLTGFLAELVSRNSPERNQYQISKKINLS